MYKEKVSTLFLWTFLSPATLALVVLVADWVGAGLVSPEVGVFFGGIEKRGLDEVYFKIGFCFIFGS